MFFFYEKKPLIFSALINKKMAYSKFMIPSLYKRVRHPLYVGWVIIVWVTPIMIASHFVFALLCTLYILAGINLEEKDLLTSYCNADAEVIWRLERRYLIGDS